MSIELAAALASIARRIVPTLDAAGSASANVAAIQAALDVGGRVEVVGAGVCYIDDTLIIRSNTQLVLDPCLTIRLTNGTQKRVLKNAALGNADAAVTSFTASGLIGTVTRTAHGRAVGDAVAITGATSAGYNGVYRVQSTPTADTYTVWLPFAPTVTTATGTILERTADQNISIIGGVLDTESRHPRKYAFYLSGVSNVRTGVLRVQNDYSDGLHFTGPAHNVDVGGLFGYSTDDFLALTAGDYAAYEVARGDFSGFRVGHLAGRTPFAGVKVTGAAPFIVNDLAIGKARIHSGTKLVSITTDTNLQAVVARTIILNDIEELNPQANSGLVVVNWNGTGTVEVDDLILTNINQELASNLNWALVACIGGAANVEVRRVKFDNVTLKGSTSGASALPKFVDQLGKVSNVWYNNVRAENCHSIFSHNSSGSETGQQLFLNGVQQIGCNVGISFRRAVTVQASGWQMGSTGTAAFSSGTSGATATFTGDLSCDKANWANLSGGASMNLYSRTFKADASLVARLDGGMLFNTNAALGTLGVAGLVVGSGTASGSWKLMADPTKSY
jgi:hypothetical protein